MGHRCGSDACAEQLRAVLRTFPVHGQEKSKGGGFTGLPAQVNILFPGLGYRLPLSSLHLPDPSSSSNPGTSHPPSSLTVPSSALWSMRGSGAESSEG